MFTLKSTKLIIILTSCSLLLTACYPSGSQALSTEDNDVISYQIENIVSSNEYLDVEAELSENITEIPKIKVKIMEWADDKLKDVFLMGRTNLEHREYGSQILTGKENHVYKEEDKYWLVYEPGRLLSEERQPPAFGYGTLNANMNFFRYEDFFTDDSISALSKEEAIKRCSDLLANIGLTNCSSQSAYAITVDKANQFFLDEEYDDYDDYTPWSLPKDEIYVIDFSMKYNNIPVTDRNPYEQWAIGERGFFVGTEIKFTVTKDKIYSVNCFQVFSPEYEVGEKVKINCSSENALKIAAEHYDNISLSGREFKITDCKLVYVPEEQQKDKSFLLSPMWKIDAAFYREGDIMGTMESLFIDVQTGNIILER